LIPVIFYFKPVQDFIRYIAHIFIWIGIRNKSVNPVLHENHPETSWFARKIGFVNCFLMHYWIF
jgi:hypothetical protein